MAKKGIKHYSPLDLLGNELLNFKAEELETDPSGTGLWKGRFWYNAVENVYKGYDGVKVTKFGSPEATNIDGLEAWILANVSINELKAQKADYSANGFKIINLATPTDAKDAVNKEYVDAIGQGFIILDSVRAASTANIDTLNGLKTIDGVDLVEGDRVLLKNQTNKAENGIFIASVNEWVRSNDFDDIPVKEVKTGAYTYVREGNQSGSGWTVTSAGTIVIGVSDIVWKQFSQAGQVKAGKGIIVVGGEVSAKVDESTITLNAEDKIAVKEGGITSKELGDASVETSKIKDAAVTKEKIAEGSVETSKIANGAVTAEKLGDVVGEGATKDAEGKIAVDKTKVAFLDEAQELTNKTMDFGADDKFTKLGV